MCHKSFSIPALLILCSVLACEAPIPVVTQTTNNEGANDWPASIDTSARVVQGQLLTGAIGQAGDKDWVAVDVGANETIWVWLKPTTELRSPTFTLYDSKGVMMYSTDSRDSEFVHVLIARAPKRFYVEVAGSEDGVPSVGPYTLTAGRLAVAVQAGGAQPSTEPTETGDWQTSFREFATRVRGRTSGFGPTFPGGSLGLMKGFEIGGCSSDPSVPGFGQVRFQATYRGVKPSGESQRIAHSSDFQIDLEIDGSGQGVGVAVFAYPASGSIEAWRAMKAGVKIGFTANVNCVMNIDLGSPLSLVTLHDAQLVGGR